VGVVSIFLLELVILLGLAKRFESEHVTILLEYLFPYTFLLTGFAPPAGSSRTRIFIGLLGLVRTAPTTPVSAVRRTKPKRKAPPAFTPAGLF
jgi:hypothetical protein